MKCFKLGALVALGLIISPLLMAEENSEELIVTASQLQTKAFPTTGVGCELRSFALESFTEVTKNPFDRPGQMVGAPMIAAYSTTSPECLRDYAVVQYIKGCFFRSFLDPKTQTSNYEFAFARSLRGKEVVFDHKTWEIDSDDLDPMYTANRESSDPAKRHNVYHKANQPLLLKSDSSSLRTDYERVFQDNAWTLIGDENPAPPVVFVRDYPTLTDYDGAFPNDVLNASLRFQTCLYRTKDVPSQGDPKPPGTAPSDGGPLQCFEWSHNHIFNYATQSFDEAKEIHPYCLK